MTYTDQAYSRTVAALHAFERLMAGLQWTQADHDEYDRLSNRCAILGAFYKVLK